MGFFITFGFAALGIPKGDACYQRDARRYFRSTKWKKMFFLSFLCSLIRTFAFRMEDIAIELSLLHSLSGIQFVKQLEKITQYGGYALVKGETAIYSFCLTQGTVELPISFSRRKGLTWCTIWRLFMAKGPLEHNFWTPSGRAIVSCSRSSVSCRHQSLLRSEPQRSRSPLVQRKEDHLCKQIRCPKPHVLQAVPQKVRAIKKAAPYMIQPFIQMEQYL